MYLVLYVLIHSKEKSVKLSNKDCTVISNMFATPFLSN